MLKMTINNKIDILIEILNYDINWDNFIKYQFLFKFS